LGGESKGCGFCLLVQFENVGSDEVAGEYAEQHDDYIHAMQVRV
jgi:hypothetical protein